MLHALLYADFRPPIRSVEVALYARAKQLELVIVRFPGVPSLDFGLHIDQDTQIDADEQHAESVRITQYTISPVPAQQLGSCERTRADLRFFARTNTAPKIDELDGVVSGDEDIEGIEIAVGEAEGVYVGETIEELVVPGDSGGSGGLSADFVENGLAFDLFDDHADTLDAADVAGDVSVAADGAIHPKFGEELGDDVGSVGVDVAVDLHANRIGALDDTSEEGSRGAALEGV